MKKNLILILLALVSSMGMRAQSYTEQFEAFKQSVEAKNGTALKPFISSEIEFLPFLPKERLSPALFERVFQDVFKEINSVSIKEYTDSEIVVFYDFIDAKTKDRVSSIILDSEGKIKDIKIIGELIKEAQERKLGKDAEQPIADEFTTKYPAKKVSFRTLDDRTVFGELYDIGNNKPVILLLHQFGYNKYEYSDIAPKLNDMGFNALAIDLTGGGTFAGHNNETVDKGSPIDNSPENRRKMIERIKGELEAAIDYLNKKYNRKVIVWGSSYSANYAISITKNDNVNAAISFSGLANGLSKELLKLEKPVFMTSSKEEASQIKTLLKDVPQKENLIHFIPNSEGGHGSSVLWNGQPYAAEYWEAVKAFLNNLK